MLALLSLALAVPVGMSTSDGALVLTHTDVDATVAADVAVVDVVQTFTNPFDQAVDATYVFPLPADAAVRDMSVSCGDRVIRSELLDTEEARKRYDEARNEGRRAALTEQQQSNVFTQSVAGLCPGEEVTVWLQYVDPLWVDGGVHSFVFPTTMGERYDPGSLREPPLVGATEVARRVSLRLSVHAGVPLGAIWSDTDAIVVVGEDEQGADIELLDDAVPDGDVHLAWTEVADQTRAVVVGSEDEVGDRYLSLSLVPPEVVPDELAQNRELIFVIDSSCSMMGEPWAAATAAVEEAMDQLRPGETFNVVRFSSDAAGVFPHPMPATEEAIAEARVWMDRFEGGGTNMARGMRAALAMPGDPEALRLVLMVTDGFIGSGAPMFREMAEHLDTDAGRNHRVFGLGIGSSVNDALLDGLALHGRGASAVLRPGVPVEEEVERFYRRIDRPALTDIEVDWGGLGVQGVGLQHPADVFAGQPLHLVARVDGPSFGVVTVTGRSGGQPVELLVPVDLEEVGTVEALPTVWARRQIEALEQDPWVEPTARDEEVLALAHAHRLVSRLTSLVAVDSQPGGCRAAGSVDVPSVQPLGTVPASGSSGGLVGSAGVLGALGTGGLGMRGAGFGGGGSASGRGGYGLGSGAFGGKGESGGMEVQVRSWPEGLDAAGRKTVQGLLKRHHNPFRYCYQRELVKDLSLAGNLTIRFQVGPEGEVEVLGNDVDDGASAVAPCVEGRFRRMSGLEQLPVGKVVVELVYAP